MHQNLDDIYPSLRVQAAYSDVELILQSWQQRRQLPLVLLCTVHLLVVQQNLQEVSALCDS